MRAMRWFRHAAALSLLVFAVSFPLISAPLPAQITKAWPRHDPDLIEKLYRGDFAHISDDNFGRMDVEAVMLAFRTDEKVGKDKCALFGGDVETGAESAKRLAYVHYLNSNSTTGEFPSAQFLALSVLGATTEAPGVWALDPNMMAMGLEIIESTDQILHVEQNAMN